MASEAAQRANFSAIRYAQCWEDADILIPALDVGPGKSVVSIASAGENTLSLLAQGAERVIALDLSPAQLACLELRVAAYRTLSHPELLELIGSVPSERRVDLYLTARTELGDEARAFWDARPEAIVLGVGSAGKFERYFELFRTRLLPLVHSREEVERLLTSTTRAQRKAFYAETWDTWRWRAMFAVFFSRTIMGRAGRDPAFFRYVEGSVADRLLSRTRYAITVLDPAENPYLHWILTGRHSERALPHALREENFSAIRDNLDRLEWHQQPIEDFLAEAGPRSIDAFNLSDIFEYVSPDNAESLLRTIVAAAKPGARLAYWNMLVPRSRPESLAEQLVPQRELADALFARDKAFFYSAFHVEEVVA